MTILHAERRSGDVLEVLGRDAEGDGSAVEEGDDRYRVEFALAVEDDRAAGLGWFERGNDFPFDAGEVAAADADAVADGEKRVAHRANLGRNYENGLRLECNFSRRGARLSGFLPVINRLRLAGGPDSGVTLGKMIQPS
jgi:hypothetical protein